VDWPQGAEFARHVSRHMPGVDAHLVQESRDGYAHSEEMQTGLRAWNSVISNRCEVTDERLEPGAVASGGYHGVREDA
jgi:hypothetical protein